MAIIQCQNNHYYDNKRDQVCPYCEKMYSASIADDGDVNEQLTSYIDLDEDDDAQLTEGYGDVVYEYEKTVGIFTDETRNELTVGWLVCTDGDEKGKSYVIHSGRNFAGSSIDMDIVLSDHESVESEKHFSLVFDPKTITYYLVCGEGHTYVNNENVSGDVVLSDGDLIEVGQSQYVFVPFCKEGREW